jgi:molybdopterin-guanine dinucleotide biosynthesis protein B
VKAIAFVGWSGSGKTTLIEKLVPLFQRDGRRVGYLKTDAHGFTMDVQGKDTARMFDAGAPVVAILGPDEAAIRFRPLDGYKLQELLDAAYSTCDLVLVEGGKNSPLPKIRRLCRSVVRAIESAPADRRNRDRASAAAPAAPGGPRARRG